MTTVAILPISDPGGEKSYRVIAANLAECVATKQTHHFIGLNRISSRERSMLGAALGRRINGTSAIVYIETSILGYLTARPTEILLWLQILR
jgi:hypothetical protein